MTAVVALIHENKVLLGGDSAASDDKSGLIFSRVDPKVFRVGQFGIAFVDSFRMGQILQYNWIAATTVMPAFVRRKIAELSDADPGPPILKFKTACVFGFGFSGLKIQSSAAITPEYAPLPPQLNNRTGTTRAFFAKPYFVPAAVAATCVP